MNIIVYLNDDLKKNSTAIEELLGSKQDGSLQKLVRESLDRQDVTASIAGSVLSQPKASVIVHDVGNTSGWIMDWLVEDIKELVAELFSVEEETVTVTIHAAING
jgi:hypothetical protein